MTDKVHMGHTARKRFGQNFLHDPVVIERIVKAIAPKPGDHLVEIGPGLGALTEPVIERSGHLTVVELDRDLAQRLREHPTLADKLTVHQGDAMKFDFRQLLQPGQKNAWVAQQQAEYPIAGWLSPNCRYGEHYLRDLVNASFYEPGAIGWAKALEHDEFAYGGQAVMCGALWKTAEFCKQQINTGSETELSRPDLYLADSEHFQRSNLVAQQGIGGSK